MGGIVVIVLWGGVSGLVGGLYNSVVRMYNAESGLLNLTT
jgi:hypothetical protein